MEMVKYQDSLMHIIIIHIIHIYGIHVCQFAHEQLRFDHVYMSHDDKMCAVLECLKHMHWNLSTWTVLQYIINTQHM